jgi:hypothetical protein
MLLILDKNTNLFILFGRVCELIFSPSVVAFRDASVAPEVLDGLDIGALERCDSLKIDGSNEFCLFLEKK